MSWSCTGETGPGGHFQYKSDIGERVNVYVMQDGIEFSTQVNEHEESGRITIPFIDNSSGGGYDTIAVLIGWLRDVHKSKWDK